MLQLRKRRRLPLSPQLAERIPVDPDLELYSLQNPPQPTISTLFAAESTSPRSEDFYGALFNPASTVWVPRPGRQVAVTAFALGDYQGDGSSRPFKVYGRTGAVETLLLTYGGAAGYPALTPGVGYLYPVSGSYETYRFEVAGNFKPRFIHPLGTYTALPAFIPAPVTKYAVKNFMGTNAHPPALLHSTNDPNVADVIPADKRALLARMYGVRLYLSMTDFNPSPGVFQYEQDTSGNNLDAAAKGLSEVCPNWIMAFENVTDALLNTYPDKSTRELVPIPFGTSQTDPASWAQYKETVMQPFYRWCGNKTTDPTLVKSRTGFFNAGDQRPDKQWTKQIGLGYLRRMELHVNEFDKYWKGLNSFLTPAGAVVGAGLLYDAMKAVDPSVVIVLGGLASYAPDWLMEFARECRLRRGVDANGKTRFPCDEYQVHFYPSSGGTQYSGDTVGLPIEISDGPARYARFLYFVQQFLGDLPVGIGELGYSPTGHSALRAVLPAGSALTLREWVGVLYLRASLWCAKRGFRYVDFYEYEDGQVGDDYAQFGSMGMVGTTGTPPNVVLAPWPNLYLLGQWHELAGDYAHYAELSASPLVDEYRLAGQPSIYALHLPTNTNSTGSYVLNLPTGGQLIRPNLHSFTPTVTSLPAGLNTISLNETPCFVRATA